MAHKFILTLSEGQFPYGKAKNGGVAPWNGGKF